MKTSIEKFIEDVIAGDWRRGEGVISNRMADRKQIVIATAGSILMYDVSDILLDPKAWQAVGKTRGWNTIYNEDGGQKALGIYYGHEEMWAHQMHRFINHLADGKSIEEALELIK